MLLCNVVLPDPPFAFSKLTPSMLESSLLRSVHLDRLPSGRFVHGVYLPLALLIWGFCGRKTEPHPAPHHHLLGK